MRTCLYCLSEVHETAIKCKYCGEWLHHVEMGASEAFRDLSAKNPAIRQAEKNVESLRFVWKASLLVCIAGAVGLFLMSGAGSDLTARATVFVCGAVVFLGIAAGALLSSVSHIVELLVIILKNQLYRENHLGEKLRKLQQTLHE